MLANFELFKRKKNMLGIDVGSKAIKLVQLEAGKDGYHLLNLGILPLSDGAVVDNHFADQAIISQTIKQLQASLKASGKEAACSVSGNTVIVRKITMQQMTTEELESQISWEAEQYIPFDINDVYVDFQILDEDPEDPSKMQVLLVASKKEVINDYVLVFKNAGLNLTVMDVDVFAVQNAFELNHGASSQVVGLVNIGAETMNINIIMAGKSLFTRDVQVGGNQYNEEIIKQLGCSAEEAETKKMLAEELDDEHLLDMMQRINESIAQEIRRSLDFYSSTATEEEKVTRLYLSGGSSKVCGLIKSIKARTDVDVELFNPFAGIRFDESRFDPEYLKEIAPLMTIAVGLAMRRVGDK
ncbi:MAG: type IV pilus assembly protein PilM [Trichlorobacter sp.]|nr:type IV pilus assembly protein PilM [Trichlorobacter sp.]